MDENERKEVIQKFANLYWLDGNSGGTWQNMFWRGVRVYKFPTDLWIYQEIIHETMPDLIIEAGTMLGGSAYYLASLCDLAKKGRVITIDTESRPGLPRHDRIQYLIGSSVSPEVVQAVRSNIKTADRIMVILDSDHRKDHVLSELRTYGPMVTRGNYMIVEDTIVNGNPIAPQCFPGPMEALEDFIRENNNFSIDLARQKFHLTTNPRGYLKRI